MAKHRTRSIEFKRQVAQDFIAGETLHGLAKRHDISRNLIRIWVKKLEAGAFDEDARAADLLQEYEAKIAALERMVGRQALEIEFLKGALKSVPRTPPMLMCLPAFGGLRVDDAIEEALLTVVGPGAIAAAAVAAEKEANQRRDQVHEALKRDLEAARYATDRAFRQYDAADPANRLVAGELEARWNKALARVAEVESKIAAHDAAEVAPATDPASLATLAADLNTVWNAPSTDARLKKRIVRIVIHEVIADVDSEAAEIVLVVHWIGGVHSEIRLPRRRRGQRNSTSADVIAAVRQLVLIANDDLIAGIL